MRSKVASLAVMLVLWLAGTVQAQTPNASVTGRVTDPSKAVIADARVTLINASTHFTYEGATNETGSYYVTDILPGTYRIQVAKVGFKTVIEAEVILHVQDTLEFNFEMALGSASESVTVRAEESAVQLATSSVSAVVDSTTVRELPLNGRSWTDLATLDPGVDAIPSQAALRTRGPTRGNRGFGNQITVSGSLPQFNNYRLDGISINDYSNGGPGSVQGGNVGVDAIQEFSVVTSNASAEYGRVAGGVVSAITRSGTDEFHGGVYEFLRNSALDARNFFDGAKIPPFRQNQFGADAGGPIWKDKVFVFGDYEGLRQSTGVTSLVTVPSAEARAGNLCSAPDTPPPTCSPTKITVDPSAQKYLPLWPMPNSGPLSGTDGDIGIFNFAGQQTIDQNFFTTRIDGKISSRDTFDGTYLRDYAAYSSPDGLNAVLITSYTNRQTVALGASHIFSPTVLNSARFGFNREDALNHAGLTAINPLAKNPALGALPGENAAEVKVAGLTPFTAGVKAASFVHYFWNSFQGYDNAVWTRGTHSLKFGGSLERIDFNVLALTDPGGVFSFSTLSDFLTNKPKAFDAQFSDSVSPRGLRQSIFGVFAQDDWRWRPNLTLNLGVRYEMSTVPTEVQGKLANLINLTDAQPHLGDPFFSNPTLRNFEPRIGFAWDPFRNGKTAVRGGFGMFDVLPLTYQFTLDVSESFPFAREGSISTVPPGSFFAGAAALLGPTSNLETFVEPHPHRNYVMQWNLNVQRELAPSLTVTVGSVGSHGVHEPFDSDDFDIVLPTSSTPSGFLFPNPVGSGTRINPNFGAIRGIVYAGSSSYNDLEVGVQKRMSHGVQIGSSFTWGKSIDNNSSIGIGNQFSNSISALPWYDIQSVRGPSDINVPRTFVINGTWLIPSPKSLHGPAGWITSGWELGAIFKANDGVPITPTFGANSGDPLGLNSSAPWDFPDRLTGPGCSSLTNPQNPNNYIKSQCFAVPTAPNAAFYAANCDPTLGTFPQCFNLRGNSGRNILKGPGLSNLDFSIYKNSHIERISESFNVQFRAEFFNILNRANFAVPVAPDFTDIFDATGARSGTAGLLTSTATTSRQIQFALKVNW
jgi:hypothetical protein